MILIHYLLSNCTFLLITGSGLGLNQDGITEAIKPSAKFDLSGIGHKVFNDFQWWDHAFNRAASSFDVKVNQDEVIVEKVGTNSTGKIKTKKNIFVEPESLAYGTFCKTGTLNNGVMEEKITSTVLKEEKDFLFPCLRTSSRLTL